jgi:hypothetical protein
LTKAEGTTEITEIVARVVQEVRKVIIVVGKTKSLAKSVNISQRTTKESLNHSLKKKAAALTLNQKYATSKRRRSVNWKTMASLWLVNLNPSLRIPMS